LTDAGDAIAVSIHAPAQGRLANIHAPRSDRHSLRVSIHAPRRGRRPSCYTMRNNRKIPVYREPARSGAMRPSLSVDGRKNPCFSEQ
jgi:hypothetical protein